MPSMASITVKKFDGTTDIVYDAVSGSGGDTSPAVWRQDTGADASLPIGFRPTFKMSTSWNGPKTARQVRISFAYPYAIESADTSSWSSKDRAPLDLLLTVPVALPANVINEAVYQAMNLMASSLVKSAAASGYAPT